MFGMSLWSFLNSSPCMAHKMHERCRKKSKSLNPINFFHLPENFRTCRFGVVVFFCSYCNCRWCCCRHHHHHHHRRRQMKIEIKYLNFRKRFPKLFGFIFSGVFYLQWITKIFEFVRAKLSIRQNLHHSKCKIYFQYWVIATLARRCIHILCMHIFRMELLLITA